jgi:acetolactate synthase-1/2/3 large subunit
MSETDSTATATTKGSEAVVDALQAGGIEHVFGLPGTTIMDLIDVLGSRDGIEYLSVRHEQAAAHMADAYWRASGKLAVALASRGPGAANMTIGVHNAYAESIPLLALVGQVPDGIAHRDTFEEMDLVSFFEPLTKWSVEIHEADRIGELLGRAIRVAQSGRPRPVLVSIPVDVQGRATAPASGRMGAAPSLPEPAASSLAAAIDLLAEASRPVVVLGGGTLRPTHEPAIVALAEALGAPVVTTWMRKNAFPNDHPAFVGSLGFGAHDAAEAAVSEADVLLALGCRFSEFTTKRYSLIEDETTIVQVDVDADEIGAVYPVEVGIVGDAVAVANALVGALGSREVADPTGRGDRLAGLRADYERQSVVPVEAESDGAVGSAAVITALAEALKSSDAILVQDAHSFGPWVSRYIGFDRPGRYYAAAGGSMGWGVPAALGIQIARPDERVIAVCGDGSFWMVAQELETAVRAGLPIVVVVTNNFSYGNTRDRQKHAHGARYVGTLYENPDFAAFMRLLGGHGERVERGADLGPALERALASGLPAVVDVIQDQHEGLPGDLQPLPAR